MIAPFVLRTQSRPRPTHEYFLAEEAEAHTRARRTLVSLSSSLAGLAAVVIAFGTLR
jgi:hypothetical protein